MNASDLSVARRRSLPFGGTRGTAPTAWPSSFDKGFVGGTVDSTGTTHLGAREYDPSLGRFTSIDPIMVLTEPQSLHGYAYSNNNPTSTSDPTCSPLHGKMSGWRRASSASGWAWR
ncbi:RHS repeat-associated core domain-containing protein [Micromonospora sp. CA-259024]|uniref:RHS repeat-associated core domain-containing protein n=1 Tax=Micromonospora sp. CA-259024 TaxID=3239965 RepID=UPI003D94DB94